MIVYVSGRTGLSAQDEVAVLTEAGVKHVCVSFWRLDPDNPGYNQRDQDFFELVLKNKWGVFLDSGAFTLQQLFYNGSPRDRAKMQGSFEEIVERMFGNYCSFCQRYKDVVDSYVTFDYVQDAGIAWRMTERMWKEGLNPIPVFHGDSSIDWLAKYVDIGCDLIGIAGLGFNKQRQGGKSYKYAYVDNCFRALMEKGVEIRAHAFAATSYDLMAMYPWFSADSATWCRAAAYGCICLLDQQRGRFSRVHVGRMAVDKGLARMSYWSLGVRQKKQLDGLFEKCDTNIDKLADPANSGRIERMKFNARIFVEVENCLNANRVKYQPRHQPLFG